MVKRLYAMASDICVQKNYWSGMKVDFINLLVKNCKIDRINI